MVKRESKQNEKMESTENLPLVQYFFQNFYTNPAAIILNWNAVSK
jgi:hypothetical protein